MQSTYFVISDEELEPLDWPARIRAIMGTAYCLEYMHNLNPPLSHSDVTSRCIFFTDDYAAKVCCISIMYHNFLMSYICHQDTSYTTLNL